MITEYPISAMDATQFREMRFPIKQANKNQMTFTAVFTAFSQTILEMAKKHVSVITHFILSSTKY